MIALDTNVWIYSHDDRDPVKQMRAQEVIRDSTPIALPWQVGCEFIAASRKLKSQGFSPEHAWRALDRMRAMAHAILLPDIELWPATQDLQGRFGFSFWDGLLVAACKRGKVTRLYTEDFTAGTDVDGLEIVNPFTS